MKPVITILLAMALINVYAQRVGGRCEGCEAVFEYGSEKLSWMEKRGGSGVITLTKRQDGTWVAKRDIVLGLSIPNYK